ncbi:hypothetical protein FA13DRAFT_1625685 [Coprinellus micaceus]|uniref:Uncharacterized protein n=1 Tax=Coprinellus micaceus TaxID=71717 RepID=A0A4Y7TM83_COPMI|nr:hypothetical protein FA13DRAFT_1625685 [Coprinellus micaceus]
MALNFGIGAGHGPPKPYNLRNGNHQDVVDQLRESAALKRLALHQSASFKFYFPKLYDYYHKHTIPVREKHQELVANWILSIFSAAAVNLGPEVATYFHRDGRNLAFGPCAIHALGEYNFTKGGHLVLKEPKLIIQFPPGCLILLPSATITHGNTPVQAGEKRVSFTQYTAGALFRYVDNNFGTEAQLKRKSKALYKKMLEDKETRWEMGIAMWPTVKELLERAADESVFESAGSGDA